MPSSKFRGVSKRTHDVIFGFGLICTDNWDYDILLTDDRKSARIVKNSGARLLGTDTNGEEIFEGDIILDGSGEDTLIAKDFYNQVFDEVYNQLLDLELCTLQEAIPYDDDSYY